MGLFLRLIDEFRMDWYFVKIELRAEDATPERAATPHGRSAGPRD